MKNRIISLLVALSVLLIMIAMTGCNLFSAEINNTDKNIKDNITEEMPTLRYFFEDNESIILSEDSEEFFNNAPTDKQIEVVYELDFEEEFECLHKEGIDFDLTSSKADELLTAHRLELKEFHTEKNFEFLEENGYDLYSEDYQIIISKYSPHVQILFEDIIIYENFYQDVADSKDLDIVHGINISAVAQFEETATRVDASSAPLYSMSNVLNHINAGSQTYTGSGINVGVLEAGGIALTTSHSELNNLTIHTVGTTTSSHAISVIRTLCGSNGIARNVNALYSH